MKSMRTAPGEAEADTFGFSAYPLGPGSEGTQMPTGIAELSRHLERSDTDGLVAYEDPATAIARLLQSGQPLREALARWGSVARHNLGLCRKKGRRIVLCGVARDAKEAEILTAQILQRFPEVQLPGLTADHTALDTFFVALAALSAGRDGVTRDLIEEIQARSIFTPTSPGNLSLDDPEKSLAMLLGRWSDVHTAFGETKQALAAAEKNLAEKISELESQDQRIAGLSKMHEAAKKAEQGQGQIAAVLNQQVTELEGALKSRANEITQLQADRLSQLEAKEKKVTELEAGLNRARSSLVEHESAMAENERLQNQLYEVYASTSWRITMPMRSIKRLFLRI